MMDLTIQKPKIYLASRYSRREEICGYRAELEAAGFGVTSRWLNGNHQVTDDGLSAAGTHEERTRFALEDWADLMNADICISFTEPPRSTASRGGRHVEMGAAMATGKVSFVVGYRENVFHCLPGVHFFETWAAAFDTIKNTLSASVIDEGVEEDFDEWAEELHVEVNRHYRNILMPNPLMADDFPVDDVYDMYSTGKTPLEAADALLSQMTGYVKQEPYKQEPYGPKHKAIEGGQA